MIKTKSKVLGLFMIAALLVGCSGEPLPSDIKTYNPQLKHYLLNWESNQISPYMDVIIHRQGEEIKFEHIVAKQFEVDLLDSDILSVGINYTQTAPAPRVELSIWRCSVFDLSTGVYNIDKAYMIYEEGTTANGLGYNVLVKDLPK